MNRSSLWRFAPLLALIPVVLADCGGSDNSDINGPERLPEGGLGGGSGDASDAKVDGAGQPGCPILQPVQGRRCPAPMLVCPYREQICACSTTIPWMCFDANDGGPRPDGGGGSAGTGGAGGSSVDAGGGTDGARPADSGRGDVGSGPDGSSDAGRDGSATGGAGGAGGAGGIGGRGGSGGTGGLGGASGTGGSGGRGGRGGRGGTGGGAGRDGGAVDATPRDGASAARDAARDTAEDVDDDAASDATVDDGGQDGAPDDGATNGDASDDGG